MLREHGLVDTPESNRTPREHYSVALPKLMPMSPVTSPARGSTVRVPFRPLALHATLSPGLRVVPLPFSFRLSSVARDCSRPAVSPAHTRGVALAVESNHSPERRRARRSARIASPAVSRIRLTARTLARLEASGVDPVQVAMSLIADIRLHPAKDTIPVDTSLPAT